LGAQLSFWVRYLHQGRRDIHLSRLLLCWGWTFFARQGGPHARVVEPGLAGHPRSQNSAGAQYSAPPGVAATRIGTTMRGVPESRSRLKLNRSPRHLINWTAGT